MSLRFGFSTIALTVVLAACGGGSGGSSSSGGSTNSSPVVDAGTNDIAVQGDTVQLAATASDSDGDRLTYTWSSNSGTFSSTSELNPTFTAPSVTTEDNIVLTLSVSDGTATRSDTVTITVYETAPETLSAPWIVNTTNKRSVNIMDGAEFVEVDVLSAVKAGDFITIETNTIPSYEIEITQEILNWYDDYHAGAYETENTLALGQILDFGDDIGLSVTSDRCTSGGEGWWPNTGGACADTNPGVYDIPSTPAVSTDGCHTGAGPVGLWVNGVPIYNWTDTFSFNNEGIWSYYAVPFRSKGMDICLGHGGGGFNNYHHHSYNACIRQLVEDEGTGHSPIYGYAGDGYPIHGPHHSAATLAKSCWTERDYSDSTAAGYCGVDGDRSCQFVDATDISQGTEVVSTGPTTSTSVDTDGGAELAVSGYYIEDFYYEATCTAQGDEYLDQYNGHSHDGLGYHYHTSVDDDLLPTFPLAPAIEMRGEAAGSFSCTNDPYIATMGGPG